MRPLITAARSVDQHDVVVHKAMGRGCQHKPDVDTIGRTVEVKAQRSHPVRCVGRIDDWVTKTQRLLRDFRGKPFDIRMIKFPHTNLLAQSKASMDLGAIEVLRNTMGWGYKGRQKLALRRCMVQCY